MNAKPALHDRTKFAERKLKWPLRRALAFLPSARRALDAHERLRDDLRQYAADLIEGFASKRFADVDAGIMRIDIAPLKAMVAASGEAAQAARR